MAGLKDIRIRIASVRSTRKITSAMKMVSAAKFHRAQEQHARFQDFILYFQQIMSLAMEHGAEADHPLMRVSNEDAPTLILVFSSNTSMCGAYNSNIVHCVEEQLSELEKENLTYQIFGYGKKGAEALIRDGYTLTKRDEELAANPSYQAVANLFDELVKRYQEGHYSKVLLAFNQFRNAAQQDPVIRQLLPIIPPEIEALSVQHEYIFEPTAPDLFDYALPNYARLMLYGVTMDNAIGEHGARMTAMTQATDNADSLIEDLTLQYNKARQAAITNEIMEIVSGAEALKNV